MNSQNLEEVFLCFRTLKYIDLVSRLDSEDDIFT